MRINRSLVPALGLLVAAALAVPSGARAPVKRLDAYLDGLRLGAQLDVRVPARGTFRPGEAVPVSGTLTALDASRSGVQARPTPGSVSLQLRTPDGKVRGPFGPYRTDESGAFSAVLPGAATRGLRGTAASGHRVVAAVEVAQAEAGGRKASAEGVAAFALADPPTGLELENSFVTSVGWVKPGATYPFRVFVRNYEAGAKSDAAVTIPPVDGMRFMQVTTTAGSAAIVGGEVQWTIGSVPGSTGTGEELVPAVRTLVVEARADTTTEDAQIVWKDLSTTAALTYTGGVGSSRSHGPKVVPPGEQWESARYGDRPFPVVPVDYFDLHHNPVTSGADKLDGVINDPAVEGSTFNLYQEMSLKQLFPHASVPSVGITTRDFSHTWNNPKYDAFDFTAYSPPTNQGQASTCVLATDFTLGNTPPLIGSPAFNERIADGWYQMPGTVGYYGRDKYGSALAGLAVPALQVIDSGCGDTGKAVYDAAHIADPEIDYSDFDTDKDGIVDFFMLIYSGRGGHGDSQVPNPNCDMANQPLDCLSYDNIWPHSSSLEFGFVDEETGLTGYISDDQLKDLSGRPLFYTNDNRTEMTTTVTAFPVFVRVGPYNVNPESAIQKASVISHEYGHSLGLPDYYSSGGRDTYGDWSLMATDKSHNIDIIGKKELGWVIPEPIPAGTSTASNWRESKIDTHRIEWQTKTGQPYVLSGPDVHNAQAFVAPLPGRRLVDAEKVSQGASPTHIWWSGSGNDFGCAPTKGHNLDIALPELEDVDAGTPVTLTFNSYFDIEWDYDYGFVLIGSAGDRGEVSDYTSVASANGYSTPATFNPNTSSCLSAYGNGLTGTSGSFEAGTQEADRRGLSSLVPGGTDYPDGPFVPDEYDISALAGKTTPVLRFSYATDPGLARPGWFIDDVKITAGSDVIYESDFEKTGSPDDPHMFNGGCKESLRAAATCTAGWIYAEAGAASTAEHAYQLEMRDRSGFDEDGKGQNDRAAIAFLPGLLHTYTNEALGYGNTGQNDDAPPTQHPLDSIPVAKDITPDLTDAAFTVGGEFNDTGSGHTDNYEDTTTETGNWEFRFDCLTFKVLSMEGDDVGPSTVGGEDTLQGNVRFTRQLGCAAYDYAYSGDVTAVPNTAPVARAQAKPTKTNVGKPVLFDGSASSDDRQTSRQLKYEWDFDGNGTYDATGQQAYHTYLKIGRYVVRLRVTDANGLSSVTTIVIQVGPVTAQPRPNLPETGAGAGLAVLALASAGAAAFTWRQRRRV